MAKLVINNDLIHFSFNGQPHIGNITRLILENDVIYNVHYWEADRNDQEECQLGYVIDKKSGNAFWESRRPGITSDLIHIIGKEIEKLPHLFAAC
ncbi:MAG: hypothetical protein H7Y42_01735 [Chitinophagaceae bacterium]|nr:hypothetical protein [Chitinophagaceae bacterium]